MNTPRILQRYVSLAGLAVYASGSLAQVTLDGTLGPAGPLAGPHYAIPAELGQQRGGNLFHSFGRFSIHHNESATFSGPNSVDNIIGRVTGGQVSTIDGALRSTISGASLYLLNPAGVLFGPNATLDVPGAVHVSTADYLRLGDGGRFDARTPGNSVLTVAPVEAFGFLGDAPGRIALQGSFLQVPAGETLSLIGGDIALTDATVYAPAGRLNVAAVGSAGEVLPTETDLALRGFGALGTLTMDRDPAAERITVDRGEPFGDRPLADLDTSGEGGGAIFIRGGEWVSRGGWVTADTYGARAGQDVDVAISGDMRFDGFALLSADVFGSREGGSVDLSATNLTLANGSQLRAKTEGAGNAGNITLNVADTLTLENLSVIGSITSGMGAGDAGDLTINARHLTVQFFSGLLSSVGPDPTSTGNGGSIKLNITDTLTVQNGGQIQTVTVGDGEAGNIVVETGNLIVDGRGFKALITSDTGYVVDSNTGQTMGSGTGGTIKLTVADTLIVRDGGQITADTSGEGNAGTIEVRAGNIHVDRQGSQYFTGISSDVNSFATGLGGKVILIIVDTLTVQNGGDISASTFGKGNAGDVTIHAGNLLVDGLGHGGFTGISSGTYSEDATGHGGSVTLTVTDALTVRNGGEISASTSSAGDAGDVTIHAGNLLVDRQDSPQVTGIFSRARSGSAGSGGNVRLTVADALTVQNGGDISADTFSAGDAGDVTIHAGNLLVDGLGHGGFTGISSGTYSEDATGHGGTVGITVTDALTVRNGGEISASTFSKGDAGDVTIHARNLLVDGIGHGGFTGLASQANSSATGDGGNVEVIVTDTLTVQNNGRISVRSFSAEGNAGDLNITTHHLTLADGGGIFAESSDTTGGNITIDADHLKMFDGSISSTAFGDVTGSDGGNVTLNSINIVALDGSTITARANEGQGGNIRVNAQVFLHDAPRTDDVLNASAERFGNDGTVELNAPNIDLSGSLVAAEPHYLDATAQLSQRCGDEEPGQRSRFIVQGRGALPPAPGDPATAPLGQCGPGALALASPAVATDAPPPPPAARSPRGVEFGFNDR